jgi:hypothetical protein
MKKPHKKRFKNIENKWKKVNLGTNNAKNALATVTPRKKRMESALMSI